MENDDLIFAPEEAIKDPKSSETWKILIVDDESDVHEITKIALSSFEYKGKKLEFIDTYSAIETEAVLLANPDIAVILLDVVMESVHAGLDLVKKVRQNLNNSIVRIILRTGQAGQAPEKEVIQAYEIDDYKTKTELTNVRLFTVILASLRSYETLQQLNNYSAGLEKKVEERTKEITAGIHYASYIQNAIFPPAEFISSIFPNHFILSKPRDIVSGDFYWFFKRENKIFFCVADCTGHGVPGAFMSMLGISFLNEIINNNKYIPANEILNELRSSIIKSLHQKGEFGEQKDGMDIAFCILDLNTNTLQYAGANNPLYIIEPNTAQEPKITEIVADKMPIGYHDEMRSFTLNTIQIKKDTALYLFSDGFIDQFGGPSRKKFLSSRLKENLIGINPLPMPEQKNKLHAVFNQWKGDVVQYDDVTIVGIKF